MLRANGNFRVALRRDLHNLDLFFMIKEKNLQCHHVLFPWLCRADGLNLVSKSAVFLKDDLKKGVKRQTVASFVSRPPEQLRQDVTDKQDHHLCYYYYYCHPLAQVSHVQSAAAAAAAGGAGDIERRRRGHAQWRRQPPLAETREQKWERSNALISGVPSWD